VYLFHWLQKRDNWESLLFSISSAAAAVLALSEQALMHAQTAAQYGEILRWMHLPAAVVAVSLIWFLRLYLNAGRTWLVWLFCAVRVLVLVVNFVQEPNFNFSEITDLRQVAFWGELFSLPVGMRSSWAFLTRAGNLLQLIFVADASITAWKKGNGRRAFMMGGTIFLGVVLAAVFSILMNRGILPGPFISVVYMLVVFLMAGELSRETLRASLLSHELRETQARMQLATDAADLGLWEWDIVRDEIWMNKVSRARLGAGEFERIDFNRFLQSLSPAEREQTRQAIQRSLDGGGEFKAEYRLITQDGAARWIAAHGRVQYGNDGKPHLIRGVSMEITSRKQAENALKESEARLREAQKIAHMGNWELDLLTNTLAWSDEIFQIFEIDPARFGASYEAFLSVVHPEDRDKVDSAYTQSLKNNKPYRIIHRLLMPDGRVKYVYEQCNTFYDSDGKPLRSVGIVQDITESQNAASERIQWRNELAHLSRVMTMSELSVSLAHEINQPLGAIMNNAKAAQVLNPELIRENTELGEILADIGKDAIRASEVVRKIRAIVKKEEVKFERLNLNVLIESVVELYRNILNKEKISVVMDLQPDLAPVRGDQVRLQQVIMNLITNASEAMRESPAKALTIRSIMQSPDRITLSISDSGPGVDDAVRDKVFQPFFTTKKDGLGMGLRISRTIIEDHGGRIWVENNPTAGVTFSISLNTDR
jgi:PAS domain S-box-containing protein